MRRTVRAVALYFVVSLSCISPAKSADPAAEEGLRQAIGLSNQGRHVDAARVLETLSNQYPSDDRIFLSLGLVYRSLQRHDEAINAFERSVSIKPSEEGYYSLGLLYEGKIIRDEPNARSWAEKAKSAWNSFLRMSPSDTKKAEVAARHIKNLSGIWDGLGQ